MERAIKVLLIQNQITKYNLPIFDLLGKQKGVSLSIAHFGKKTTKEDQHFKEIVLESKSKMSFFFSKKPLKPLCNRFDVVIALGDIHWINIMSLGLGKRKYRLIYWGIGVSASYANKFDENKRWDFLRFLFMRKADALVFYSEYPVDKYVAQGFAREKLFVAPNTLEVKRSGAGVMEKDTLLFIGTLYKEKGIYDLLNAYEDALQQSGNLPQLNIIGGGREFETIRKNLAEKGLEEHIHMLGPIYSDEELEPFFLKALACISPGQAGLSVLKSMGFGVAFVTREDAITGGERLNIENGINGILYRHDNELKDILLDIRAKKDKYIAMGENGRKHYEQCRTPMHMVRGFLDAIHFVNINN